MDYTDTDRSRLDYPQHNLASISGFPPMSMVLELLQLSAPSSITHAPWYAVVLVHPRYAGKIVILMLQLIG